MIERMMKVTITVQDPNVGETDKAFFADYHKLYNREWAEVIQEMLDEVEEVRNEKAHDHALDNLA